MSRRKIDRATGEVLDHMTAVEVIDSEGNSTGPIPGDEFRKRCEDVAAFALEAQIPGHINDNVVAELCRCYHEAADYAAALTDAIKAQAEKHKIEPKALRMYIAALCSDKRDQTKMVADDLARLLDAA